MIKISLCLSDFKRVMFSYFEGLLLLLLYVKGQIVENREAWRATVQGSRRVPHDLATEQRQRRAVPGPVVLRGPLPVPGLQPQPRRVREGRCPCPASSLSLEG